MDNKKINFNSLKNQPSDDGKFGEYGGMFVAETLMPLILSLSKKYNKLKKSSSFQEKLKYYQKEMLFLSILMIMVLVFQRMLLIKYLIDFIQTGLIKMSLENIQV